MRLRIVAGVLSVAVLIAAGVGVRALLEANAEAALRTQLEAEFEGAYPAKPLGGGNVVEVELVASTSRIQILDGPQTEVWSYNGSVPGPELRVELGDTLSITVRNELPASTTVHWHGIRVPNDMDGVPDINQPHIESGDEFVYEFTPPDAGTFWYHSHTDGSEQLERGLYGSLVVADPSEADRTYDQDVVWVIDDWLLLEDGQLDPEFDTSSDRTHNGRWGTTMTVNARTDETLEVRPGERIRLRLINASNGRVYAPDFGELPAELIAVDGLTVRKVDPADDVVLAPGNRVDIDVTAPAEPGIYEVSDTFTGSPTTLATVVVSDSTQTSNEFDQTTNDKVPTWDTADEAPIDQELLFQTNKDSGEWQWTINGYAFPDYEPFELSEGEFAKISLVNQSHLLHPIHLHGQFFKVLSRNGEKVDEPFFRDTVLLDALDVVEIGMVPLDVGEWVVHCHIQEHASAGMMTVMKIAPVSAP